MHDDTSAFLANIENEKLRARIQSLACLDRCDLATVFPKTRAMGAAGDVKKRIVMLRSVEPRLDRLPYPGERIELVTKGTINAFAEQYFMGIWSIIINRTLILCTNFRIILLSSDNKGRARALMWQIPYDRLKKYGRSMGNITFKCVGGTFLRFVSVPAIDRKRLKQYLADRIDHARAAGPQFPSHADRDPLCPMCATPQPKAATACAECATPFINPAHPAVMSLVIPGLGDLYLGHTAMGVMELLGFALLLLGLGAYVVTTGPAAIPESALILVVANVVDAAMTYHVARKGKLAKSQTWRGH
jgi:hypothetical protein